MSFRIRMLGGQLEVGWLDEHDRIVIQQLPAGTVTFALSYLAMQKGLRPLSAEAIADTFHASSNTVKTGINRLAQRLPIKQTPFGWDIHPEHVDVLHFESLAEDALRKARTQPEDALKLAEQARDLWEVGLPDFGNPVLNLYGQRFVELKTRLDKLVQDLSRRPTSVVHNLPAPDEEQLLGRAKDIAAVRELLRPYPDSIHSVVLIDGMGGIGKTALAKAVGYSYVDAHQPDGFAVVVWTSGKTTKLTKEVSPLVPSLSTLDDVHSALAITLDRPDIMVESRGVRDRLIRELLSDSGRRVLLVVDNLETVTDPEVQAFLENPPPPSKVLVTTRHALEGAKTIRLSGLNRDDAKLLVLRRAERLELPLDDASASELASAAAGVPLAILYTLGQMYEGYSLEESIRRLRSASGDYAEFAFHGSAVILQDAKNAPARALLFAASLFEDRATASALGFVAGLSAEPNDVKRDAALRTLRGMALLNRSKDQTYGMLSLTRDYVALDFGRDLVLKEAAVGRWIDWHLKLARSAVDGGADLDTQVLDPLRRDHRNVIAAIDYAHRQRQENFFEFIRCMAFFWLTEGLWADFDHYVSLAKTTARRVEDKIRFSNRLLWLSVLREDLGASDVHRRESEQLLRRHDVPYERMRLLDFSGQEAIVAGDFDKARELLEQGLEAAKQQNDHRGLFATQKYLGEASCLAGDLTAGRKWLKLATASVGGIGEIEWLRGQAHLDHLEGLLAEAEEEFETALAAYDAGLARLAIHRDARLATRAKEGRGRCLAALGDRELAAVTFRDLSVDFESLGMWEACDRARTEASRLEAQA